MAIRADHLTIKLDSREATTVAHALSAEQRLKLLSLLSRQSMNVNEIAATLGISQPTASVHIRILEKAGLVKCEYSPTERGSEKRCWTTFDKLIIETNSEEVESNKKIDEITMPVGLFTSMSSQPPCGLSSAKKWIGSNDNPQSFLIPERAEAEILWFSSGWIEYTFPFDLPPNAEVTKIEYVVEICSETPCYNNIWPSDITVWMNGVEIGTWLSPGDFGGTRGKLNPDWWPDCNTQYGMLKFWSIDKYGCSIDGNLVGDAVISDLNVSYQKPIVVRIGNKENATHIGGINIFGKQFGNYPQDPVIRIHYTLKPLVQ